MNLMLMARADETLVLEPDDPRIAHICGILGMKPGDSFDVGAENGPRGKAKIVSCDAAGMALALTWGSLPRPPLNVSLVVGLSRPQTMRKVLREAPALGVRDIHVAKCMRSEPAYAASSLWTTSEWRDLLRLGTEQAFSTFVPALTHHDSLEAALNAVRGAQIVALDNYEATVPLAKWRAKDKGEKVVLCIGPERGWDGPERDVLRGAGCTLAHLGPRVLRTETAMIAGVSVIAAGSGEWDSLEG
jgi:16S rRNA (uracil1498-N3)-methyltransferase